MKEEKHIEESKFGFGGLVLQPYFLWGEGGSVTALLSLGGGGSVTALLRKEVKNKKKQPKIILTNKQNIDNILKKILHSLYNFRCFTSMFAFFYPQMEIFR